MAILEKINCKKEYLRKSDMTTGNAYKVKLSYKGKRCEFVFYDNYRNESDKNDFLYSLLMDADAYNNSRDMADFADEFCYDDIRKCMKAYNGCKAQAEKVKRLFTEEEVAEIYAELEEAGY